MHQIIITIITAAMISYPYVTITIDPWQHGADVIIIKKMYMGVTYSLLYSSTVLTTKGQDTDITAVLLAFNPQGGLDGPGRQPHFRSSQGPCYGSSNTLQRCFAPCVWEVTERGVQ